MARSSKNDPIDKFRFMITVLSNDVSKGGFTNSILNTSSIATNEDTGSIGRAGFSECSTPKVTINNISYRENIHGNDKIQVPGLTTYEPVTLKRGATLGRELYFWYKEVNNSAASLNKFTEALSGFAGAPFQKPNFRREVLVSSLGRDGTFNKHWLLYNAWPNVYKGSDDFSASSSEISLEQLSLVYETFLECKGNSIQAALADARKQAEDAASQAGVGAITSKVSKLFG
jgi:phage tail-like protein